jgi:hypothetical protein
MPQTSIPVCGKETARGDDAPLAAGIWSRKEYSQMTTVYKANGNGGNGVTTFIPPTTKVITGVSLVHRKLSKTQLAVLAADVEDGLAQYVPTHQQVARDFGVSQTYIDIARKLTPGKREAILRGWDSTPLTELMPRRSAMLPAPNGASITNLQLEHVIRIAGIDRVIEAACAVDNT